jgi:hypothetical protein
MFGAAERLAERVAEMTDGSFEIRTHPAGEIVPALEVLGAVQTGTVQVGQTASYYYKGKNPQRLTHQTRLQSNVSVAHFALDFSARDQRGDAIHNDDIQRAGTNQRLRNFQSLFAGIWLGDIKRIQINPDAFGVCGIKRVFHIYKRAQSAQFLRFGNDA